MTHDNRSQRTIKTFDGERVALETSLLGGTVPVTLGRVYAYDNGQSVVKFERGKYQNDWYVWSEKRQSRLATYATRRDLQAAYERSNNADGAYGCAALSL